VTPETFWHWVGGRRFSLTVGAGIVHTILLILDKLTGEQFVMLTMGTVAVYIGANTYQKAKETASA
jgi:hypothetical protein